MGTKFREEAAAVAVAVLATYVALELVLRSRPLLAGPIPVAVKAAGREVIRWFGAQHRRPARHRARGEGQGCLLEGDRAADRSSRGATAEKRTGPRAERDRKAARALPLTTSRDEARLSSGPEVEPLASYVAQAVRQHAPKFGGGAEGKIKKLRPTRDRLR
jgi:hypothetical protein